jgi:hypothetical protein
MFLRNQKRSKVLAWEATAREGSGLFLRSKAARRAGLFKRQRPPAGLVEFPGGNPIQQGQSLQKRPPSFPT